jgi:hypothetical protein
MIGTKKPSWLLVTNIIKATLVTIQSWIMDHEISTGQKTVSRGLQPPDLRLEILNDLQSSLHNGVCKIKTPRALVHRQTVLSTRRSSGDQMKVSGRENSVVPLQDIYTNGGLTGDIQVESFNLKTKLLECKGGTFPAAKHIQGPFS